MRHSTFRGHHTGSTSTNAEGSVDASVAILSLRHHLSERLSAGVSIPTGVLSFDGGGSSVTQRASGFGDVELTGRYALQKGSGYQTHIDTDIALSLPTGTSHLATASGGEAPPNILSVGRGSFGARARISANKFMARTWALRSSLSAASPVTPNASNIVFGTLATANLGASFFPSKSWIVAPEVSASYLSHSRSTVNGQLVNSGGYWLHAGLSAAYRVGEDLSVSITARTPVYLKVNGSQITETLSAVLQVGYRFGGGDNEEKHEHGDGDEHDGHGHGEADEHEPAHEGQERHPVDLDAPAKPSQAPKLGDIQDAATNGASFDASSIAVPGKITIVDFWARWCGPCKPLTQALEQATHQDPALALRKVEVPTFDTAVAQAHIANAKGLPIVWLYNRKGERVRVLEQKSPADVLKAIRELQREAP